MEHRGIHIPSTADEWELYSDKPGAGKVATELFRASKKAIDIIADGKVIDLEANIVKAEKTITDVCVKHDNFGAADSEPLRHARGVVNRAVEKYTGRQREW